MHFTQKDFVEVWDKVFDTLGPYPSTVYAYDSGKELNLTYNDIRELEMDIIRDFTARGFVPGDRVAITGPPSPHYLFFSHAMSYMGITCALIDNTLPTEEIEKLIRAVRSDVDFGEFFPYLGDEPYVHYYDSLAIETDSLQMIYRLVSVERADTLYDRLRMIVPADSVKTDSLVTDDVPAPAAKVLKDPKQIMKEIRNGKR